MKSIQGQFLVASRSLKDLNFYQTIVLMIQHNDEGALGLVLNRPTDSGIAEVWEMLSEEPCKEGDAIYLGGPVPGPLIALHDHPDLGDGLGVIDGVYMATEREQLNRLVNSRPKNMRLFSGYSGWAGGQLEQEIEMGGWLTATATRTQIFSEDSTLWSRVTERISLNVLGEDLRRRMPDDPSLN